MQFMLLTLDVHNFFCFVEMGKQAKTSGVYFPPKQLVISNLNHFHLPVFCLNNTVLLFYNVCWATTLYCLVNRLALMLFCYASLLHRIVIRCQCLLHHVMLPSISGERTSPPPDNSPRTTPPPDNNNPGQQQPQTRTIPPPHIYTYTNINSVSGIELNNYCTISVD